MRLFIKSSCIVILLSILAIPTLGLQVISTAPPNGAVQVPRYADWLKITFSEDLNWPGNNPGGVTLIGNNKIVPISVGLDPVYAGYDTLVVRILDQPLDIDTKYTLSVGNGVAAHMSCVECKFPCEDCVVDYNTPYTSEFTTRPRTLAVTEVKPSDGATGVSRAIEYMEVFFSEPLRAGPNIANGISLEANGEPIDIYMYTNGMNHLWIGIPQSNWPLDPETTYTLHIARDAVWGDDANELPSDFNSQFTTEIPPPPPPPVVAPTLHVTPTETYVGQTLRFTAEVDPSSTECIYQVLCPAGGCEGMYMEESGWYTQTYGYCYNGYSENTNGALSPPGIYTYRLITSGVESNFVAVKVKPWPAKTRIDLSVSTNVVSIGEQFTLSGSLYTYHMGEYDLIKDSVLPGRAIHIQHYDGIGYSNIATVTTDSAGDFSIILTQSDSEGSYKAVFDSELGGENEFYGTTSTVTLEIVEPTNQPPVANAGPDQSVFIQSIVTLDGSGSYDPEDGSVITYQWTITDKPTGSNVQLSDPAVVKPTFTSDVPGDYIIQLFVIDTMGAQSSPDSVTIHAQNQPPVALFKILNYDDLTKVTWEDEYLMVGGDLKFDASASFDPDGGKVQSYYWDFGDGTSTTTTTPVLTKMYYEPKQYTIKLTVTDDEQQKNTITKTIDLSLLPGDLLFCRSPGILYSTLFTLTGNSYTHVGMYLGNDQVIETTLSSVPGYPRATGVQIRPLSRWFNPRETYVSIERVQTTSAVINNAIIFARSKQTHPYDFTSIALNQKQLDESSCQRNNAICKFLGKGYYCSELTWASFASASGYPKNGYVNLGGTIGNRRVSPDQIAYGPQVRLIGFHKEKYPL